MIREIDANLISPDKLFSSSDMAKLGCNDCRGCSDCCRDRAGAITLDPYDMRLLKEGLNFSFEGLLEQGLITLSVEDGMVLPALGVRSDSAGAEAGVAPAGVTGAAIETDADGAATGADSADAEASTACVFLGEDGRCQIHDFRPGICRMFPLARIWHEDGSFSYFLQQGECSHANGVKIRISKWLGYPDINGYERAVRTYHDALRDLRAGLQKDLPHEEQVLRIRQFLDEWFVN